jgi:gamma-glutamyl phosphate reductase
MPVLLIDATDATRMLKFTIRVNQNVIPLGCRRIEIVSENKATTPVIVVDREGKCQLYWGTVSLDTE